MPLEPPEPIGGGPNPLWLQILLVGLALAAAALGVVATVREYRKPPPPPDDPEPKS